MELAPRLVQFLGILLKIQNNADPGQGATNAPWPSFLEKL